MVATSVCCGTRPRSCVCQAVDAPLATATNNKAQLGEMLGPLGAPTSGPSTDLTTSAGLPNASIWIGFVLDVSQLPRIVIASAVVKSVMVLVGGWLVSKRGTMFWQGVGYHGR